MFRKIYWLLAVLLTTSVYSHPTSYKGSVGVMGEHSPLMAHNQLNYSWRHWFATGMHYYRRPLADTSRNAGLVSTNFLVKRWNKSNLQANLYALGGVGFGDLSGQEEAHYLTGAQFDIEDRDYYFLVKHKHLFTSDVSAFQSTTVRAGFTPYVGDFDELHSWIIVDVTQMQFSGESPKIDVTPTLRLFYQNLLFEAGYSYNGNFNFNYITHF